MARRIAYTRRREGGGYGIVPTVPTYICRKCKGFLFLPLFHKATQYWLGEIDEDVCTERRAHAINVHLYVACDALFS